MSWMKLAQSTSLDGYSFTNCTFNNSIINLPSPQIASTKNGKDKYSAIIKNSSRYGSDTHRIWIFKTAKNDKISVVFELRNERNGFLVLSDFWHYHSSELDTVKSTYDSLIKISEELKNKIESDDVPISLVTPMFKNSIKYIDIAHKEKSTVNNLIIA